MNTDINESHRAKRHTQNPKNKQTTITIQKPNTQSTQTSDKQHRTFVFFKKADAIIQIKV